MKTLAFLLYLLTVVGCATAGKQTRAVIENPPPIPRQFQIEGVPFLHQPEGYCGPATLTMTMNWAGDPITVGEIAPKVMTETMKGSLQTDMITASRRHGYLAVPIEGLENLLMEVAAGHPVIALENLGFSWYPQWHYSLITGYDLKEQTLTMHTGARASKTTPINYFERNWKLANYWGLVVLPTTQLSATASELDHLQAAVALEAANFKPQARELYKNILGRWPQSLGALVGLGNLAYETGNYKESVEYLEVAVRYHPNSAIAKNNLAVAQNMLKKNL